MRAHTPLTFHPPCVPQLVFSGKSAGKDYVSDLTFLHAVDPEKSTTKIHKHSVQMHIVKADVDADFWARLLKDKIQEKNSVTIDWDK